MHDDNDSENQEQDIVSAILQCVIDVAPEFSIDLARQVEVQVREKFGGRRLFVNKRAKRMTPRQRQEAFKDCLTDMPTSEIIKKHKISRSTLTRLVKKSGRF